MGVRTIKLPDVGEGVAQAEIVEWHVKVGDVVVEDQTVVAVMTDKATVEIPAPFAGKVVSLGADVGSEVAVGGELLRIDAPGMADESQEHAPSAAPPPQAENALGEPPLGDEPPQPEEAPVLSVPSGESGRESEPLRPVDERPIAAPAVRKRARDAGVDLRQVRGSGPAGRIGHEDLDRFLIGETAEPSRARRAPNTAVEEVKVVGLRRRIAQRMADSKRRAAHFSYVEEIDVTAIEELRAALNGREDQSRPRLTLLPILMMAMVKAVAAFPQMNAHYDDENEIVQRYGGVHIAIATHTPAGLMVPVVKHVEALDLWDCARELQRVTDAAREGRASRDELSGSTITITSLGALGGIVTTPVINRPEVAIVGVNRQVVRPVWQFGQFVPRTMMNLSSSFDHRVVDGYDAARFVQNIRTLLEAPATIFIEV